MKAIDKKTVKRELLWQGHEDWTGLWEAVWWIQTEYPNLHGVPARDEARALLTELLVDGMVHVCRFDEDTNGETLLHEQEALELFTREESWEAPEGPKGQLRFATTEKGAEPLFKKRAEAPS